MLDLGVVSVIGDRLRSSIPTLVGERKEGQKAQIIAIPKIVAKEETLSCCLLGGVRQALCLHSSWK